MNQAASSNTLVRLDLHKGSTMMRLATTYPTLRETLLEAVQNAIDSNAKNIRVTVNYKTRSCSVLDDGEGVSTERFQQALLSIGQGIKSKEKLGRFGLGLISPLDKCRYFTFISCAKPQTRGYIEWRLEKEAISKQSAEVHIPRRMLANLNHTTKNSSASNVWWRSSINIFDFTEDRVVSAMTIDDFVQGILDKYSERMLKNNVKIRVLFVDEKGKETLRDNIRGLTFIGRPLSEFTMQEKDAGKVVVRMYLTKPSQRGKSVNIKFGELDDDHRFTFANFCRSFAGGMLDDDVMAALKSGIFEGEVLAENVSLAATRTSFERSEAVVGVCAVICEWFKKIGEKHLNEESRIRTDERYQVLGRKTLDSIQSILKNPSNSALLEAIKKSFGNGTIGDGHAKPAKKNLVGQQQEPSLSTQGKHGSNKSEGNGKNQAKPEENQGHTPLSVQGPRGNYRRIVKNGSIGLQLAYDDLRGLDKLWELDRENGVLVFNTTHPIWASCEKRDWTLCALQEYVILSALTLEAMPEDWRVHQRLYADECLKYYIQLLLQSGSAVARPNFHK